MRIQDAVLVFGMYLGFSNRAAAFVGIDVVGDKKHGTLRCYIGSQLCIPFLKQALICSFLASYLTHSIGNIPRYESTEPFNRLAVP